MLNLKQRPLSSFGPTLGSRQNKTFTEDFTKQLKIKIHNHPKKYYINISHRKINNSFTKALQQKKLFYNKIYNRNIGRSDVLGLSEFVKIQKEKDSSNNSPIRTKDFSSTGFSSSNTYKKINLKSKSFQKYQKGDSENKKSFEISLDNDLKIYSNHINKQDKICEVSDKDFEIYENKKINNDNYINNNSNNNININNNINNASDKYKKRPISVSALINRQKFIEEDKLDINLDELNPDMKIKNCFIVKFGYLLSMLQKIILNADWFRINYKSTFLNISNNLSKKFDLYNKILLDKILDENCLQSFYNFCEEILNWQKMALEEIRYLKKENVFLLKKQKLFEKELNIRKTELKEINENIIKYDLVKLNQGKLNETKVQKIKSDFNSIESNYVLTVYQLQNEIAQLKNVIKKNKEENMSKDEFNKKLKILRDEFEQKTNAIYKDQFNLNQKDKFNNVCIEELSQKIEEFKKEKNELKDNELKLSEEIINLRAKLNRMNEAIKEKDEIIAKLNNKENENEDLNDYYDVNMEPASIKFIPEIK